MVKVCSNSYPNASEAKYKEHFEKYSFPLSTFQKYAIEAIINGNHVLVTAHTGSGKTLPAEFAIEYFASIGKKVIYTSPIKALSNQKFYEFTNKYPHISFGIITGDIKCNPEAQVLIMTTEILLNKLYQVNSTNNLSSNSNSGIQFDMDIHNELTCVIFDEVHYINDQDRGKVWEQSIMMLPKHVQMVMLSATIDSPETFALWCETRCTESPEKIVYLSTTYERIVPLTHYSYITTNNGIFKAIKDKALEKEIRDITNQPFPIQNAKGEFNELHYFKMHKMLKLFSDKNVFVKRQHVLNNVTRYLTENEMLPALCFVLSRKQLEKCAKEVTTNLLEFDSKVPYIIKRECEQIIRKLPNFEEYLHLPEYTDMVALLEKGIAIHHAGVMPVLREMVELLYGKGYIKLLFATETFAVGINMPTKTVIFTDVNKFDGNGMRMLHSHEYTQMAGRAGRRGIDTVGHVIHLNNLFKNVESVSYKSMMKGAPPKLVSKFKISYNLLLNLIDIGTTDFTQFAKRSLIQDKITTDLGGIYQEMAKLEGDMQSQDQQINRLKTPKNIIDRYIDAQETLHMSSNKKRKELERAIQSFKEDHKTLEQDTKVARMYNAKIKELKVLQTQYGDTEQYLNNQVQLVLDILHKGEYIEKDKDSANIYTLTRKGIIASHLRELHCLVFAELIENKFYDNLTSVQLVGIFSCFTNITVAEDIREQNPRSQDKKVAAILTGIKNKYDVCLNEETQYQANTGTDYHMNFDVIDYVMEWTKCDDIESCKYLLHKMETEKEIFLGEFVKALLKINNIATEMEKIAETQGEIEFLHKLREIQGSTLKYVATNQSLYI